MRWKKVFAKKIKLTRLSKPTTCYSPSAKQNRTSRDRFIISVNIKLPRYNLTRQAHLISKLFAKYSAAAIKVHTDFWVKANCAIAIIVSRIIFRKVSSAKIRDTIWVHWKAPLADILIESPSLQFMTQGILPGF